MSSDRDSEFMGRLAQNDTGIKEVDVKDTNCQALAKALKGNTHVSTLTVELTESNGQEQDDVDSLKKWKVFCEAAQNLPSLEKVRINFHNYNISEVDFDRTRLLLQHTRQIKDLAVYCHKRASLRSPFLPHFALGISDHPALEKITLPWFDNIPTESLELFMLTFATIPNLKSLALNRECDACPEGEPVAMVHPSYLVRLLQLLSLEHLELWNFSFSDEHSLVLQQGLGSRQSRSLRSLEFVDCHMTVACLGSIAQGIADYSNIQDLRFDSVFLSDYSNRNSRDFARFLDPLSRDSNLRLLAMKFFKLDDEIDEDNEDDWEDLAFVKLSPGFDFLRDNTGLTSLILEGERGPYTSSIPLESVESLCRSLWTNSSLKVLDLSHCGIQDYRVNSLADMVRNNVGLKRIELDYDCISAANTLIDFVPALAQNTTLESLGLTGSFTGHFSSVLESIKAILTDSRLKRFSVTLRGHINPEHWETLVPIMAQNYFLEELQLFSRSYTVDADEMKALDKKLQVIAKLNKFGRRYLVDRGQECQVAGVALLSAVRDDLDCLYYHLRENPSLCEFTQGRNAQVRTSSSPPRKRRNVQST